jgi:predicted porin
MKSVFTLSCSRLALLAAFGLAMSITQASAADLGGNCCADLEERVAELEATTARKGNRKVSLTISGWVNEAVFAWDDGSQRNVYVGTNSLEQSRVRFVGEAQIMPGYSAGYTLEIGAQGDPSNKFDQLGPAGGTGSGAPNTLVVRKSNWWLKSKDFGKVTVGLEGTATYHLLDDADGANTRNVSDAQAAAVYQGAFFLRSGVAGVNSLRWSDILRGVDNGTEGQNGRRNIVRYDSPTVAGFVLTASWGEDDQAGVSLTYKNTWGDFNILAKGGWEKSIDENLTGCAPFAALTATPPPTTRQDCEWWGGAATIMHAPTGLYVYGGYGQTDDHGVRDISPIAEDTSSMWFIQGGVEQKWTPLGKTTIFGEYRHDDVGSRTNKAFGTGLGTGYVHDGDLNFWAAGVVQNIDAAAMDLYIMYRHADGDLTNSVGTTADLDAFDMVITGARIQF